MSWADSRLGDNIQLYTSYYEDENGNVGVKGYAYGAPWVAQALLMDDIIFATPEEARKWWAENYE